MNFRNLFTDDRAVSPVIGVILMVAITVILAAVIGTFVLGLGNKVQTSAPSASFQFSYKQTGNGKLTITDNGGDTLQAAQIKTTSTVSFDGGGASGVKSVDWTNVGSKIKAGDSMTITGTSSLDGATVKVVWTASSGDKSATLGQWSGPNA